MFDRRRPGSGPADQDTISMRSKTPTPDPTPRIARFRGDRRAALSLTFDDGFRAEVRDALEILDPLGLKGTFFLIPHAMAPENPDHEKFITFEQARELIRNGHEVGTHGQTKYKLHEADDATLDEQINGGWQLLADRTGVPPRSYAAPGGSNARDPRVQAKVFERHLFLRLNALGYGNTVQRRWSDRKTRARLKEAAKAGEWLTACIHSIVGGYSPFASKAAFRVHCEWLRAQDEWLWVAPMGEVGRYERMRDAARVEILSTQPRAVRFRVVCDLEPRAVFDRPLTAVVSAPAARAASATDSDGRGLRFSIRDGEIRVEAPADGRPVTVAW